MIRFKDQGICWEKRSNKWVARINSDKKTIWLGRFKDKTKAAEIYNQAALRYHGQFARLNQI